MKRGKAAIVAFLGLLPAAASSAAKLGAVDLYRSDALALERVDARFGNDIRQYARLHDLADARSVREAARLKAKVESGLMALAPLAYAQLYYGEYVTSARRAAYVTLDVVDAKDAKARMPFRRAPRGQVKDPQGLLASWRGYAELGQRLFSAGRIDLEERPECLGFYCLWGMSTPELANYEKRFFADVGPNKSALLQVLAADASGRQRAAALYLLSYLQSGDEVSRIMTEALNDPSPEARTAAMRVLADITTYHKKVFVDVSRVVPALDYPSVPDRAGALGVLVGLADNKTYRPYVLSHAAVPAARLLRLSQPGNQDLAFTLLSMLSETPYDRSDYDSWMQWAQSQAAAFQADSSGR